MSLPTSRLSSAAPDVSFANCGLPYHIGGEIASRDALSVQTPASLHAMLNLRVLANTEATDLDRTARTVTVVDRMSGQQSTLPYDKLILAPGAAPLRPPLPGIDHPADSDAAQLGRHGSGSRPRCTTSIPCW